ncbi:MAG: nucleotidyltransferase [Solirubrobacteraceae bacterium]
MPEWPRFRAGPILRRLGAAGVEFVVIGGIAAVAHGSPQITRDLDIVYATGDDNTRRLARTLIGLNAKLRGVAEDVPFVPDARTLRHVRLLTLDTDEGPLDVMAQPDGSRGYEQLLAGSIEAIVEGTAVRVAGIDDLIAMKKAAGRPKDRIYVEELQAIKRLSGA